MEAKATHVGPQGSERLTEPIVSTGGSVNGDKIATFPEDEAISGAVPFPIAIVGMAMRLPGGVQNDQQFWDMLINKRDGNCKVPESRYNIEAFYDESGPTAVKTQHGYFLQHDIGHIDRSFFAMSKSDAAMFDPQQRLLMEVVWECMENAGQTQWCGTDVGCFVGVFGEDWLEISSKDSQKVDRCHALNTGDFALSNRLSWEYDLTGPSITYRTACSSSLVGLHEACQAIYTGECSSAIVAGANLILTPTMTISMCANMVLSPSGLCRTFDAAADGYGRGEAINAVYIKPLHEALKQGDPIRAVIRSTAVNCDGRTPSITTPGSKTQERLVRRAYEKAGIEDICQTAFFECHGTATTVGDTAETSVVAKLFEKEGVYIGAVKPNVGHSEGASGLTSVIKAVLSLENKIIPPNTHFSKPNPNIPFEKAKLKVPTEPTSWPEGRSERVSINSFGIGGTNAHAILESYQSHRLQVNEQANTGPRLLALSAKSKVSLQQRIEDIQKYLTQKPTALYDLAYNLGARREHMAHRAFAIAEKDGTVTHFEKSRAALSSIVFIFTGQGAQWPGMGKELMSVSDRFLKSIRGLDGALRQLESSPNWKIEEELQKDDDPSRIREPEFAQTLSTAVQIALVDVLQEYGVYPSSVIGHSSGEVAAAYASGAIGSDVAISLSYLRGQAIKQSTSEKRGAMAAVGLPAEKAKAFLTDGVTIACENSPRSVTLSGNEDKLVEVLKTIQEYNPDTFCRRLQVSVAYHSDHMQEPGQVYEDLISPIFTSNPSMITLYSTVTGKVISDPSLLDAAYWRENLQSTVLFNGAVQTLLRDTSTPKIFVEIGPHSTLSGPLRQILQECNAQETSTYIPTLIRDKPQWRALLTTAGCLYINGASIQLPLINGTRGKVLTDIPSYPWLHEESFLNESRVVSQWKSRREAHHEILGSRSLESSDIEPSWRNVLKLSHTPWLWDHVLGSECIFPCAGYIAMIGEAIRQHAGSDEYTIRTISMMNPLILDHTKEVEMLTTLRPAKLSNTADSEWYDFTVIAIQNGSWKKHCVGQVRAGADGPHVSMKPISYPRHVSSEAFYSYMKARGLNFGPSFRLLDDISASTSTTQAAARIKDQGAPTGEYALHPTLIDQGVSLVAVAATQGKLRLFTKLCIPAAMENIYVSHSRGTMSVNASGNVEGGSLIGKTTISCEGKVAMSIGKVVLFALEDTDVSVKRGLQIATEDWRPHIDFALSKDHLSLSQQKNASGDLLEKLLRSLIIETAEKVQLLDTKSPHLGRYQVWLTSQAEEFAQRVASGNDTETPLVSVEEIVRRMELEMPQMTPLLKTLLKIFALTGDLLEERITPQDVLGEDGIDSLYVHMSTVYGLEGIFPLLGHSNPAMRVLEIGTPSGIFANLALHSLTSKHGTPMYSKYTIIAKSAEDISETKERTRNAQGLEYVLLDTSKDPVEQGFQSESYDLIIASRNFAGETKGSSTLKHVRALLAPGGRFIHHGLHNNPLITYVMGIYPWWWAGHSSDVGSHSTPEEWNAELLDAGFPVPDTLIAKDSTRDNLDISIIPLPTKKPALRRRVVLLYLSVISEWAQSLAHTLADAGHIVDWCAFGQQPPSNSDVVSLLDLEGPFFANLPAENWNRWKEFLTQIPKSKVLWVTKPSQMTYDDARYALVLGFARTIRQEMLLDFATFEIDKFDSVAAKFVINIMEKLQEQNAHVGREPDYEFALKDGIIHVSRFDWMLADKQIPTTLENSDVNVLDIGSYGVFSSLSWTVQRLGQLEDDQVEVDIKYVGLNFRDMMVAMGFMGDKRELGLEASGIVRRVGPRVKHLRIGDRVMVVKDGLFCNRRIVPEDCCYALSDDIELSLEDAATIPSVQSTVLHSLLNVANIREGQSILIHSACGGVGLAAIQLCQQLGVEIFATVGNPQKVEYLVDTWHIPKSHIFDSRSPSFFHGLMGKTCQRGVDVVLNSLSGELLHLSWKCVARGGKMIELGKRDILDHGKLDMNFFSGNRSFIGVDMLTLFREDTGHFRSLMQKFNEYLKEGKFSPIRPVTVFDAVDIEKAFWHMQGGRHIGKILVKIPDNLSTFPNSTSQASVSLSSDASFLLVGGLGGLGRVVASWMVEKGARHFVFLSRSGGVSEKSQVFLKELESQGCTATAIAGSVANLDDVHRAVEACKQPLEGVIQMSMVMNNQLFTKVTHEEWLSTLAPKVEGTRNLHDALNGTKLRFFVAFSSISAICGNVGQASYSAAGSFLDCFMRYRRELGLAGSVINLGLMEDIGYAHEHLPAIIQRARSSFMQTVDENDMLKALELAICAEIYHGPTQFAVGLGTTAALSNPGVVPFWGNDARYAPWKNVLSTSESVPNSMNDKMKDMIESIQRNPGILDDPDMEQRIIKTVSREVASRLTNSDDMDDNEIANVVIESLVVVEIRSCFRQFWGLELPLADITTAETIGGLGKVVIKALKTKYQSGKAETVEETAS